MRKLLPSSNCNNNNWRYQLYAKRIIFMFLTIPLFFFLVEVSLPVLRRREVFNVFF